MPRAQPMVRGVHCLRRLQDKIDALYVFTDASLAQEQ